jgi:hypothetical protein
MSDSSGQMMLTSLLIACGLAGLFAVFFGIAVLDRLSKLNRKLHRIESHTRRIARAVAPEEEKDEVEAA